MNMQLQQLRTDLNALFPERRDVIAGALCAILASEHVLLIGPPGTAKSNLVRSLAKAFDGIYQERLITKFSTPDELFGPISLKALEEDRFARVTAGKMPEAEFGFIDEIFKANSAILNSLLTLINERVFHNDGAPVQVPLISLFGASNELPEGKELEALFDRFILRFDVGYLLRPANMRMVLTSPDPVPAAPLGKDVLRKAQKEVAAIKITDATVDVLLDLRDVLRGDGFIASDRRWKKSLRLVQAAAYMAGASQTTPEDLTILTDALWREPKERPKIARLVGKLADPIGCQAMEILEAARETAAKVQALKNSDRKQYLAQAAQALEEFRAQQTKLAELGRNSGTRAKETIIDAQTEVNGLHAELARSVSTGLGLGMRSVK